jgi:molybdopterin converting factor small subunit
MEVNTVADVLRALTEQYPAVSRAIWGDDGSQTGHVAVILNGCDVRHLDGEITLVQDDQTMDVFPPVDGGVDKSD